MGTYYDEILKMIGISSDQFLFLTATVSGILILVLLCWNIKQQLSTKILRRQYDTLMRGNQDIDLEQLILKKFEYVEKIENRMEEHEEMMEQLREDMKAGFSKSALVRYDAFDAMSGSLSFVLALLNQEQDGYLLNVLYGTEGCYTYIKEIEHGQATIDLSEEEQEALELALEQPEE